MRDVVLGLGARLAVYILNIILDLISSIGKYEGVYSLLTVYESQKGEDDQIP